MNEQKTRSHRRITHLTKSKTHDSDPQYWIGSSAKPLRHYRRKCSGLIRVEGSEGLVPTGRKVGNWKYEGDSVLWRKRKKYNRTLYLEVIHKLKHRTTFKFSSFWVKTWLVLVVVTILANHLTQPEYFPLNESYRFPLLPSTVSILLVSLFLVIGELNFQYFKSKYFSEAINTGILSRFFLSTLGYDSIVYIILFYSINGIEAYNFYELLVGLSITLLICFIGTVLIYAKAIYKLHRFTSIEGKLKVLFGGKITLVSYEDIAFAYSQNKIAYIVKSDGTSVATDFTLNEIEEKINAHSFYRANRQTILHASSVEQVQPIENGKLSVLLKPALFDKKATQLTISRYKKQEFLNWFENRS